jgi:hypothetical protein
LRGREGRGRGEARSASVKPAHGVAAPTQNFPSLARRALWSPSP